MFDNLRDFSDTPLYEDDEQNNLYQETEAVADDAPVSAPPVAPRKRKKSKGFLGMTAQQRFLLSVMLMLTVCLIGTLAMFVLGRMSIF